MRFKITKEAFERIFEKFKEFLCIHLGEVVPARGSHKKPTKPLAAVTQTMPWKTLVFSSGDPPECARFPGSFPKRPSLLSATEGTRPKRNLAVSSYFQLVTGFFETGLSEGASYGCRVEEESVAEGMKLGVKELLDWARNLRKELVWRRSQTFAEHIKADPIRFPFHGLEMISLSYRGPRWHQRSLKCC